MRMKERILEVRKSAKISECMRRFKEATTYNVYRKGSHIVTVTPGSKREKRILAEKILTFVRTVEKVEI